MAFLDDLQTRVLQTVDKQQDNINSFLADKVNDLLVKVTKPKTGNLSAAEIAAGARGGDVPAASQAIALPSTISFNAMYLLPVAAALGAVLIFSRSRRRG